MKTTQTEPSPQKFWDQFPDWWEYTQTWELNGWSRFEPLTDDGDYCYQGPRNQPKPELGDIARFNRTRLQVVRGGKVIWDSDHA